MEQIAGEDGAKIELARTGRRMLVSKKAKTKSFDFFMEFQFPNWKEVHPFQLLSFHQSQTKRIFSQVVPPSPFISCILNEETYFSSFLGCLLVRFQKWLKLEGYVSLPPIKTAISQQKPLRVGPSDQCNPPNPCIKDVCESSNRERHLKSAFHT